MNSKQGKTLVAYFSRKGKNYVNETIANLSVGNTEVLALMINESIKGDIFRIRTVNTCPRDYKETTEVARKELQRALLTSQAMDASEEGLPGG